MMLLLSWSFWKDPGCYVRREAASVASAGGHVRFALTMPVEKIREAVSAVERSGMI